MNRILIEVDLAQAESRFVAYDGPVPKLIEMYKSGMDVHKFVASHPLLFNRPVNQITKDQRQLGKKTGHAANYGMEGSTLSDMCLKDMDLVISAGKADQMIQGYHDSMEGGVRAWQQKIRDEVTMNRRLTTPFGRERFFYDRPGPKMDREAFSYRPQSTVLDVTGNLMLHLFGKSRGIRLINQVHDSVLLDLLETERNAALDMIKDQNSWNPEISLPGGKLRIPIEVKVGKIWNEMEVVYAG